MNKTLKTIAVIFLFISLPLFEVFGSQTTYNECIKNADIGNYIGEEKFDGIEFDKINIEKAKIFCLKAIKTFPNNIKVLRSLGRIFQKSKEYQTAFKYFKNSSEKGDGFSMWRLSMLYYHGNGITKNYEKAFYYMSKSAKKNFIFALEKLGDLYAFGEGTKVNLDKAFEAFKKCASFNIEYCLFRMSRAYEKGELNQQKNNAKKLDYFNKLIKIDSSHGYVGLGEHLLENAKSELDIRNALLNLNQAGEDAYSVLLNLYLFPEDYPIYFKMYPKKKLNKQKGLKILNSMIDNTSYIDYDITIELINAYFSRSFYTKVFKHEDFKNVLSKLEKIHIKFDSNNDQASPLLISNLAAKTLGNYYYFGYYGKKNLSKAISYYLVASDRNDYEATLFLGWSSIQNKDYENSFKYNSIIINKSNDPELVLQALSNNAMIDSRLNGFGTNYQLDNLKKASEIIDKYRYWVEWPYENLAYLYYLPIKNLKDENTNKQDLKKAKFYHKKYYKLAVEQYGIENVEKNDLLKFLFSKFEDFPSEPNQAAQFLEYAAVSGYNYAYHQLAWFYSGIKNKDHKKEIYKWYYICSILADEETQNTCKTNIKEWELSLSYYDRKKIEQLAADYILKTNDRLVELNRELGLEKQIKNYANNIIYGNYHALLIGVNNYKNFPDLRTPINDINRLGRILKTKYKFDINKLTNPSRRDLLKQINNYTKSLTKTDNLIIYFAGHGMQKSDEGFWLTKEAEKDDDIDWISNNTIVRKLREIKANNILVVADSCFSGLLTRGLNIENNNINKSPLEILHKSKSRIAITSGGNEPVLDGGGGKNSIFAASLASELEQRSTDFTASELFLNIQKKVIKETLAFGMKQSPIILDIPKTGHENFDFVFNPK